MLERGGLQRGRPEGARAAAAGCVRAHPLWSAGPHLVLLAVLFGPALPACCGLKSLASELSAQHKVRASVEAVLVSFERELADAPLVLEDNLEEQMLAQALLERCATFPSSSFASWFSAVDIRGCAGERRPSPTSCSARPSHSQIQRAASTGSVCSASRAASVAGRASRSSYPSRCLRGAWCMASASRHA